MRKEQQQVACQLFMMKGMAQGKETLGHRIPFTLCAFQPQRQWETLIQGILKSKALLKDERAP